MSTSNSTPYFDATPARHLQIHQARGGLLVFTLLMVPLSLFGYWFYITFPDAPLTLPSLPLMLAPALASIITRLLRHEGFADVSFRLRGRRMGGAFLLALGLPLITGALAYGAAYLFNLAQFAPPPFPVGVSPAIAQFGLNLVFAATVGILLLLPTAAGEEIGWRGYLLPRLVDARLPQPVLLTALIWGAWHLPVVFAGVYAAGPSLLFSGVMLMLATGMVGSIFGWMRLETGSIWPCILAHAAWNAIINGAFTPSAHEVTARLWTGETGILVVLVLVPVTLLVRRAWQPSTPVEQEG